MSHSNGSFTEGQTAVLERAIEQIGEKEIIELIGKERVIEQFDMDDTLAHLGPAKRRALNVIRQ